MQLIMETLSPVHVGSGEELLHDLDYIQHDGAPLVVDQNRCFEALAAQGDVTAVSTAKTLSKALQGLDQPYGYTLPSLHNGACNPQQIRQQIKDAQWRPLIPGSSLKGAIRTALLAEAVRKTGVENRILPFLDTRKGKPSISKVFAGQKVCKNVFGSDPKTDWMRAWKIGDTSFTQDDLSLADVRYLNLGLEGDETVLKWKNMSGRNKQSFVNWEQAPGVHAEALVPGAIALLQIHVDDFLLHGQQSKRQLHWGDVPDSFVSLREILNKHAAHRLRREVEFYSQHGCQPALNSCIQLMQIMEQEEDAIYLQTGWGSGWRGMTGDWQHDVGIESDMRKLYELGKMEADDFPKTRRLAVFDNAPSLPFGWLRLWLAQDRQDMQMQAEDRANDQTTKISSRNAAMQAIHAEQQRKQQEEELHHIRLKTEAEEKAQIKAAEEARKAAMTPLDRDLESWVYLDANFRENAISTWVNRMQDAESEDALRIAMKLRSYLQETGNWLVKKKGARKERVRKIKAILQQYGKS